MDRYKINSPLGENSLYTMMKAENIRTGDKVSIKQMKKKFYCWADTMDLKEVKILRIAQHPNILQLKEIIRNDNELFLVYELASESMLEVLQKLKYGSQQLSENQIKSYMKQLISVVNYIHQIGFFHRDITPNAIFIDNQDKIKLSNFMNSREIQARQPLTDYISARWYRSPEQILRIHNYNNKIDIFALGCIMAEFYLQDPIFDGVSEQEQLKKIAKIMGVPNKSEWPEFQSYLEKLKIDINIDQQTNQLDQVITNASKQALDLLSNMLTFNPAKRLSCAELLQHPFFQEKNNNTQDIDETQSQNLNQEQ